MKKKKKMGMDKKNKDKKEKKRQGEGDRDERILVLYYIHGTNLNLLSQFSHIKRVVLISLHESSC